jgi:hypothetical protein
MKAIDKAAELILTFGKVLAPLVVDEIIKELKEPEYSDVHIPFWYAVKEDLLNRQ